MDNGVNINTSTVAAVAAAAVVVEGRGKPKPRKMAAHSKPQKNKKNGGDKTENKRKKTLV